MAKFTSIERELIEEYIFNDTLRTSLSVTRECMEELWHSDAPRIVQDFTDHGEKHCERLVAHVDNLLKANDGKKLTELEMYLLLAGVYLHDIGMQCDVVKFPAIKEKAKELGAVFKVDFTASNASRYSIEEQISIRENHHYLTAAWITYAYKTGQTIVGSALNKFPNNLVSDLIDVCKYHSKLPITNCESSFMFYPIMRKRLVTALLRISDELDIDSNRVSLETVKNFSFGPEDSLFWWLHNLTTISFLNKNLVQIKILLNPVDKELYGSFIQQEFIEKFKNKNEIILDFLAKENIPIRIDSNSKVEEYEFTEKLPAEVIFILDNKRQNSEYLVESTSLSTNRRTRSINKSKNPNFEYDVALSFAGENREIVEQIAKKLTENNISVFYDKFEKSKLWGVKLSTHLQKVYGEKTRFVVVFVSTNYPLKDWTNFEFTIARGESKNRKAEFILPVRLDYTSVFGLPEDVAYLDFNKEGVEGIVDAIIDKMETSLSE